MSEDQQKTYAAIKAQIDPIEGVNDSDLVEIMGPKIPKLDSEKPIRANVVKMNDNDYKMPVRRTESASSFKMIEHETRMAYMKEEHDLKIQQMKELHSVRMTIEKKKLEQVEGNVVPSFYEEFTWK